MAKAKRVRVRYENEDGSISYTPSQVKRLAKAKQIEVMVAWFNANYEDPVQEMPYVDGEYIYVNGGPFDASDAIQDEFSGLVPFERMEEAIGIVEQDGTTDWAPTRSNAEYAGGPDDDIPDHDQEPPDPLETLAYQAASKPLKFADPEARKVVRELLTRVEILEQRLDAYKALPAGIGHNGAPDDEPEPGNVTPSVAQATKDVSYLKEELREPEPDAVEVVKAVTRLSRFGKWLGGVTRKLSVKIVEKVAVDNVIDAGRRAAASEAVSHAVSGVVDTAVAWGHTLFSLF